MRAQLRGRWRPRRSYALPIAPETSSPGSPPPSPLLRHRGAAGLRRVTRARTASVVRLEGVEEVLHGQLVGVRLPGVVAVVLALDDVEDVVVEDLVRRR